MIMLPFAAKPMTTSVLWMNDSMGFVKRPMAVGAMCCFAISILSFYYRNLIPLFAVCAAAVIFVFTVFLKMDKRLIAVLFIIFAVLFSTVLCYRKIDMLSRVNNREIIAELTFCEDEKQYGKHAGAVVAASGDKIPKGTKLYVSYYKSQGYRQGDRILARVFVTDLKKSEYRASRYADNVFAQGSIVSVERKLKPERFGSAIGAVRRYVNRTLFDNMSYKSAATMNALVTGERGFLSDDFNDSVGYAGVSHVMVVSGLHLSIIMGALGFILNIFGKNRFVKTTLSVIAVLFIAAVCGFTMSIMRAGIMFIVSAFAPLAYRENDSVNSLGTAVVLIHIHSPFAIFSVAFQLSLLSTYGVLVLSPAVMDILRRKTRITNGILLKIAEMLCVTLSATFMTLPVVIYRFGYVSVTAPIVNILITHAVSAALVVSVLGLIPTFEILGQWIFIFCEITVRYINFVIELLGQKWAVVHIGRWAVLPAVFTVVSVLALIKYCKYKENLLKLKKLKSKGAKPCL